MECGHAVCTCRTTAGEEFCGPACREAMGEGPYCGCAHPECMANPPVAKPPIA